MSFRTATSLISFSTSDPPVYRFHYTIISHAVSVTTLSVAEQCYAGKYQHVVWPPLVMDRGRYVVKGWFSDGSDAVINLTVVSDMRIDPNDWLSYGGSY
jgi:hypothetical protein